MLDLSFEMSVSKSLNSYTGSCNIEYQQLLTVVFCCMLAESNVQINKTANSESQSKQKVSHWKKLPVKIILCYFLEENAKYFQKCNKACLTCSHSQKCFWFRVHKFFFLDLLAVPILYLLPAIFSLLSTGVMFVHLL